MVKNFINKGVSLLSIRQTDIISAATVIMLTIAISKLLGVIKLRILSARFTPEELGVFLASFRLPNLLFDFLVLGALTSAFIPVFTRYLAKDNKNEAFSVSSSIINISILLTIIFSVPIFFFSEDISRLLAPGFSTEEIIKMASFTRIIVLAQVIPLLIGTFFTGILQSFKNFLIPALAPVVYDVGIIICILIFSPSAGLYSAVYGVVVGAILFLLIQLPTVLSFGYRPRLTMDYKHPGVKEIGKLMAPRTVGLMAYQLDSTIDLILASLIGARAVTIFTFAQTLQQLPILLFGSTIAQASLPTLSEESTSDLKKFKSTLLTSLHQILFLVFPASVILIVLRIPIVRLAYGAKLFDWEATILTGKTLALFAVSVFAQSAVALLARAFYALHDSKTPVAISIVSVAVNIVASITFINFLQLPIWGLALSTSIASLLNAFLLLFFLNRKIKSFSVNELFISPLKIFLASVLTGICLYIPMKILDQLVFDTTRTINLIMLTTTVSLIGFTVYFLLAVILKIKEASLILGGIQRLGNFRKELTRTPEIIDGEKPNP